MIMRDELGVFYADEDFAALFPSRGQPAETPWRLALVLVFQFAEGLSDEQAADAVRSQIDWKYALSLELTDPGFDATVLSEFRARLVQGSAELRLLDLMLARFKGKGLLKARGRQRTDSTWTGYKVHLTETCDEDTPNLITHVLTTEATTPDWHAPEVIHTPSVNNAHTRNMGHAR